MKISSLVLLQDLKEKTKKLESEVGKFKILSENQLNFKPSETSWSILECIEHLNLYGDFYLVEIEKCILNSKYNKPNATFKSGWLGEYFANAMLIKDGKITKMQAPKDKNPKNSDLSVTTLDRFLKQQERLLQLLELAEKVDLARTKTGISISKLIQLRLGDTFRVVVYHNERHVIQVQKILAQI